MTDWLRPLLLTFYAPARAMAEVRDRVSFGGAALLALLALCVLALFSLWQFLRTDMAAAGPFVFVAALLNAAGLLLFVAIVYVPAAVLFSNLFERRGSFGLVFRQEYAPTAATVFYALTAASLAGLALSFLARLTGVEAAFQRWFWESLQRAVEEGQMQPEMLALVSNARLLPYTLSLLLTMPLFAAWSVAAVRQVFRLAWPRAVGVVLLTGGVSLVAFPFVSLLSAVLASPFLLLLLFFLLRGYFGELTRSHRARAAFRQNLEAATLNPADASAHYNLGLLHLQRKELEEARARFERAVEIDADETDSHFQLGRIAREQNRLADAIKHFEQVVVRDEAHAQHEIWREIGATYLAAGQFSDSLDALTRFLERRPSDPEALYLKGRALAGMGRAREASDAMQACIEAVRTSPAYKYRADKRSLNEAQQFLRTQE